MNLFVQFLLYISILQCVFAQLNSTATIPFQYPLFKQCDQRWGNDIMDTITICQHGCLMSSTAMGLSGVGIPIPDNSGESQASPKNLNVWLKNNDGYDGNNGFVEAVLPNMDPERIFWPDDAMHKSNDLSYATLVSYMEKGRIVIANVMNGEHFVLLIGYSSDNDTLFVNDAGFNTPSYSYSKDVVGYRIFDMARE